MNNLFKGYKKKKESSEELRNRISKLCKNEDCGLCSSSMDAQVALNELSRYLLGENWYTTMPLSQEQVNTEIVYAIEQKYKPKI